MDETIWDNFVDGSRARIEPDGTFDLTLANGVHVLGEAEDVEAARAAAKAEHDKWVIDFCWARGSYNRGGKFCCPVK